MSAARNFFTWDGWDWESEQEMRHQIGPIAGGAGAAGAATAVIIANGIVQVVVVAGLITTIVMVAALVAYRLR